MMSAREYASGFTSEAKVFFVLSGLRCLTSAAVRLDLMFSTPGSRLSSTYSGPNLPATPSTESFPESLAESLCANEGPAEDAEGDFGLFFFAAFCPLS